MKATINKQTYDTEKATLIAETSNYGGNDFRAWVEKLYLTRKGNWFLHGWGGALTKYADQYLNRSSEGDRIIPITEGEAYEWCEEHQLQEAIDSHFKGVIEDA